MKKMHLNVQKRGRKPYHVADTMSRMSQGIAFFQFQPIIDAAYNSISTNCKTIN